MPAQGAGEAPEELTSGSKDAAGFPLSTSRTYEQKVFRLALLGGLPAVVIAITLLVRGGYSGKVQWTLSVFLIVTWLIVAAVLRERVVRPLQTLSNLLGAPRARME